VTLQGSGALSVLDSGRTGIGTIGAGGTACVGAGAMAGAIDFCSLVPTAIPMDASGNPGKSVRERNQIH
jgi:hypothetical protein